MVRISDKSECFVIITLTLFLVKILISVVWDRKYQAVSYCCYRAGFNERVITAGVEMITSGPAVRDQDCQAENWRKLVVAGRQRGRCHLQISGLVQ